MNISLFCPINRLKGYSSFKTEEIEKILTEEKFSNIFRFSLLKKKASYLSLNFHLMFVQLLNLKISEINNEPGSIEVTIRLSNILMLAYVFQLMVSLACCVLAFIYLESSVVKILALVLPIIIYFIGIINFQFFKFLALN